MSALRHSGYGAMLVAVLAVALMLTGCSSASPEGSTSSSAPAGPLQVQVSGNRLIDGTGGTVVLHGVNRSGTEYACIDGWGIFDGPSDQASLDAMKAWGVNAVRIPLNSACWLDLQDQFATYNPAYSGQAYQDAIAAYVSLINANGMYAILDLQWTGCGDTECVAKEMKPMPARPDATEFWTSVAGRFKDNSAVLFDLFNEPRDIDWGCWKSGGCTAGDAGFTVEGMQPMVDAVRGAGATSQPILLGGLSYANDMTGWLANLPTDPSSGLVASIHLYNFNAPCPGSGGTAAAAIECFSSPEQNSIVDIAAQHPVVFGELGQNGCATDFVAPMLDWMAQNDYSVLGWAWNTADCSSFPALISAYDGTPTAFGKAFQTSFAASATAAPSTPPATDPGASTSDQIISRGRPAFSSTGTGANANDDSYATAWQLPAGTTGWLAYDLSGVPDQHRKQVVLAWYTALDDAFTTAQLQGGCPAWSGRPFLGSYTVEVNGATGGGEPPDSGWTEVAEVHDNLNLSGQHLVPMAGANWIRITGGGPNGIEVNVDVADASAGDSGGWLFVGDSVTAGYAGHVPLADADSQMVGSIPELVAAGSKGQLQPLGQNNGVPCSKASDALTWIDPMLDEFHGKYVTLNFGTNDGWGGQGDLQDFYDSMTQLVKKVQSSGRVAVIPTITWPNNPGLWDAHVQKMNDQIRKLYTANPKVIPGPDLYRLVEGRPELYKSAGDVHFNDAGSALLRQAWAATIVKLESR